MKRLRSLWRDITGCAFSYHCGRKFGFSRWRALGCVWNYWRVLRQKLWMISGDTSTRPQQFEWNHGVDEIVGYEIHTPWCAEDLLPLPTQEELDALNKLIEQGITGGASFTFGGSNSAEPHQLTGDDFRRTLVQLSNPDRARDAVWFRYAQEHHEEALRNRLNGEAAVRNSRTIDGYGEALRLHYTTGSLHPDDQNLPINAWDETD